MALFSFGAFASTGLGPVAFGYVELKLGFRWINWILMIASGAFTATLIFILDETRGECVGMAACRSFSTEADLSFAASVLLSRKAARLRKETGDDRYLSRDDFERNSFMTMMQTSLGRPIKMLSTEPVLVAFTVWISFTWGVFASTARCVGCD